MTSTISVLKDPIRKGKVTEGIQFLHSHFQAAGQQLFPRKMSTALNDGRQFTIYNEDQILHECEKANYIDCRLNAYPIIEEEHVAPSIIFIDIDGDSKQQSDKILRQTLKTIKSKLNGYLPTALWTGNGYHIYVVLDSIALELIHNIRELSSEPSRLFLKFAESCLTNKSNDSKHNPSFKSCLLRIPGTINSKCIGQNLDAEVKMIEKFQGSTPLVRSILLHDFRLYLADIDVKRKRESSKKINNKSRLQNGRRHSIEQYDWIEKLLLTPISDCRKCTIDLVLTPYLIVIKNLPEKEVFTKIKYWIEQCNKIRPLIPSSQYFDYRISDAIRNSSSKKIPPISLRSLRQKYPHWFATLKTIGVT